MNKFIFLFINSMLFITGICSVIFHLPYLCSLCLLLLSLLLIWNGNWQFTENSGDCVEKTEDILDNADLLHVELSLRIQELVQENNLLSEENQRLKKSPHTDTVKTEQLPHPMYACPLVSSLPIRLNAFFTTYINEHASISGFEKFHFDYHCSVPDAQTYLSGSALTIICDNALDNIIKFSPPSESICIRITELDSESLIIFKNTGDGLSVDEVGKVFDLNYMGSNRKSGNGLGLAQIRAIVDDFGGHVWAKSSKGTGFALYVQLPEQSSLSHKEKCL